MEVEWKFIPDYHETDVSPYSLTPSIVMMVSMSANRVTFYTVRFYGSGFRMKVEIWSDVVCPFCYIGKRRFEAALAQFDHADDVEIVWRSFELDPHAARRSDQTLDERLAHKYGVSLAQASQMNARVTAMAEQIGLDYHLDRARPSNTFDAHRLIHFAAEHGLQGAMQERLMRAYFTEGQPIGDPDTLVSLAAEIGLDADAARQVLATNAYADEVHADQQRGAAFGIRGVPFFAIDETYGVSGAQATETFMQALNQAWRETHPLVTVAGDDDAICTDVTCVTP